MGTVLCGEFPLWLRSPEPYRESSPLSLLHGKIPCHGPRRLQSALPSLTNAVE